ncbi:MAG TPA: tetratricopeptide repeat protein [Pyrinomonadaceae bacterium]|jgi:regulator of sirC expression with transglutaminase-like and TPR domain|nr:tetratricopeptide repeat protein [Pyrinomonadaceae bacterium]
MENIKFLFQLYIRPAATMSDIIDRGSWLAGIVAVLIVSGAFFATVDQKLYDTYRIASFSEFFDQNYDEDAVDPAAAKAEYDRSKANFDKAMDARARVPFIGDRFFSFFSFNPTAFYQPILAISVFYVPLLVLLMSIFGGLGSFGLLLRRDYGTLATCTLMGWAAAHLPFAIAGIVLYSQAVNPAVYLALWAVSSLLFGVFVIFALRTVFGANFGLAILAVAIGWIAFTAGMYVFQYVSPWLFSPFLLFYAVMYFGGSIGGEVRGFGNAFRQRQNFNRFLHNATVNPKDADAHVQLGLIYLQRRQNAKALEHLNKAIEIDPEEIDANYQLGKIARQKGDLQDALNHFSIVVEQDDKYSLNEIWREIGATYMAASMNTEAADALEKYVDRRPVDPEGLYYLGKVLKAQGKSERAREMFEQAVESVKIAPHYRRREIQKWQKIAEKEI